VNGQTTNVTGAAFLPLTGYQFLPFFSGGGSTAASEDQASADCGTSGQGASAVAQKRAEEQSEVANLQSLPIFTSMMGGGGFNNPFSQFFMMYAMGTAQAYNAQSDVCVTSIQRDLQLGRGIGALLENLSSFFSGSQAKNVYKLLQLPGTSNTPFDGVSVAEYRKPVLSQRVDNAGLHTETRFVKLSNDAGIVQADALNPFYAVLEIDGIRHVYNRDQVYEKAEPALLREGLPQAVASRFHLQLNSYKPSLEVEVSPEIGNCQIGTMIGSTGQDAVPRVLFDWR
jgi:hypothetical protein